MTSCDRRLAALAAVLAPEAAPRLLSRLASGAAGCAELAARLAGEPRASRLAALADSLDGGRSPAALERLRDGIGVERAAAASALAALAPRGLAAREPAPGALPSAALARLCAERVSHLLAA